MLLIKMFGDYGQVDTPTRGSPPLRISGVISNVRTGDPDLEHIRTVFCGAAEFAHMEAELTDHVWSISELLFQQHAI
jgi:hypothetical protein